MMLDPALLAAILAHPADDWVRLVAADWLEEHGEDDRAALIRYGIGQPENSAVCLCLQEARDFCLLCRILDAEVKMIPRLPDREQHYVVHRGFVSEIRCTLAQWIGGECQRCGTRGVLHPRCYCPDCRGTGRTPGCGAAILTAHPIERVVATDRRAILLSCNAGNVWNWMPGRSATPEPESPWFVGPAIYALLDLPLVVIGGEVMDDAKHATSEDLANAALSKALLRYFGKFLK